jgi:pimeloyl-ACP methyl ester carboxylesterase
MTMTLNARVTSERLAALCAADGEFMLTARYWTGGFRFVIGQHEAGVLMHAGKPAAGIFDGDTGGITLTAAEEDWGLLLSANPPRFFNDIFNLVLARRMQIKADQVLYAQYYPALMRAVELLRPATVAISLPAPARHGQFDSPVGRYIHLDLAGQDYRIYFEEAGQGIPVLMQHTAGAHGAQWRHLFECRKITDHFRLITYDLPFHGKSVPPVGPKWWAEEYRLDAPFLRSVPVTLSRALQLDRPVFMGCSVGGLLALDLARHHPEDFRAVIAVEGALHIGGDKTLTGIAEFWHPQVSNEYKARLMNGIMAPASPEAYRKETSQIYASGWPPVFLGDLNYYFNLDLREEAARIDTQKTGVHIFSGEYDSSGTMELGKAAHDAIPGSHWTGMNGIGHFPMSENPELFLEYLLPALEKIRSTGG